MKKTPALVSGDTWERVWRLKAAGGAPLDLTGATARLHLRDETGALIVIASSANGRLTLDGPAGRIGLRVPAATMTLPAGRYRFALELTFADGRVRTPEQETLVVREDATHD